MVKPGIIGAILLLFSTLFCVAQKPDSIKIDTNLINRYRIDPPKNILPVRSRPLNISPQPIPITLLDYQVSYWRKTLTIGINVNQAAFSGNWTGGGVSSIALGANFDFKAEYKKKLFSYNTEVLFLYGISKNKGQYSEKTNDRIFYDNKVATQVSKTLYFFGSFSFESQFSPGYNYSSTAPPTLISNFMAPGYFTESAGLEYKPVKYIDLRFGAASARQTFVVDTTIYHNISGNYGVTPGNIFRNEIAAQIVGTINKDIATNMNLQARYALLIPYNNLSQTTHRLDATLLAKVNRFVTVTINGTILYDITTSTGVQASQTLALGVIYKFP